MGCNGELLMALFDHGTLIPPLQNKDHAMTQRQSKRRRFLVMPGRGISGPAMEVGVVHDKMTSTLTRMFDDQLKNLDMVSNSLSPMTTRTAFAEISEAIEERDFTVVSQRFDDGPAVVTMTDAARLALEASNPDLRILPITHS